MLTLFIFALVLLIAVLVSELADRSIISTAVLFLLAGMVAGEGGFGLITLSAGDPVVKRLAEFALFSVLFNDGMRAGIRDLAAAWHLPGRALLVGMPLVLIGTALLGHYLIGLGWPAALLLGAVLSPTDPVFAAAIVGREEIPGRLRHLLNVESGLNDGLALPVVLGLLAYMGASETGAWALLGEMAAGIGLGIGIPWLGARIEQTRYFSAAATYQPLFAVGIGLLVLAASELTHANPFLAAFAAGVTMTTVHPEYRDEFHAFGEQVTELLKLAAVLVFGALIVPAYFAEIDLAGYLFILLTLLLVRFLALGIALLGSRLDWRERITVSWFGPKGFASVVYGLLVLKSNAANAEQLFHLIAVVTAVSILLHSSSDTLLARWFAEEKAEPAAGTDPPL